MSPRQLRLLLALAVRLTACVQPARSSSIQQARWQLLQDADRASILSSEITRSLQQLPTSSGVPPTAAPTAGQALAAPEAVDAANMTLVVQAVRSTHIRNVQVQRTTAGAVADTTPAAAVLRPGEVPLGTSAPFVLNVYRVGCSRSKPLLR